ncbi:MAG: hypothetical protein GY874_24180 [Desulfobacteraceae bacterium]|nr:hypothetical protein [Desulfobacteraceae bacterium]
MISYGIKIKGFSVCIVIVVILLLCGCSDDSSKQENIPVDNADVLNNGGFETGERGDDWYGWNWKITLSDVYEGDYAAETQTTSTGAAGIARNITVETGKHYKFTCYIKTEKTNINAFLRIQQRVNGESKWKTFRKLQLGNTSWTQYSIIFTPSNNVNIWRCSIWKDSKSGSLWSDNWKLIEIDANEYRDTNSILSCDIGELDSGNNKITNLVTGQSTVADLLNSLKISKLATAHMFSDTSLAIAGENKILTKDTYVRVFAENGAFKDYYLEFSDNTFFSTQFGVIDGINLEVSNVPSTLTVSEFKNGLIAVEGVSIEILDQPGGDVVLNQANTHIASDMVVLVASGTDFTEYNIQTEVIDGENYILKSLLAQLDESKQTLTLREGVKVIQLLTSIKVSDLATFYVATADGETIDAHEDITEEMKLVVTAPDKQTKEYNLILSGVYEKDVWVNKTDTLNSLVGKNISLTGNSKLYFSRGISKMAGCFITIDSDSSNVYLQNIRPQDLTTNVLLSFAIADQKIKVFDFAEEKMAEDQGAQMPFSNAMLRQYYSGSIITPYRYADNQAALVAWSGKDFTGGETNFKIGFHRGQEAILENGSKMKSFYLKKGFMVSLATAVRTDKQSGADNTFAKGCIPYWNIAYSRNYIASEKNFWVNLEKELAGKVNHIVVKPWHWISKKGTCTKSYNKSVSELNGSWWYSWLWQYNEQRYPQYVPMVKSKEQVKQNSVWDQYLYVGNEPFREAITHLLGFNEPTGENQGDITVDKAIQAWPRLLETGARLGSPAPMEGTFAHNTWLKNFLNKAAEKNYRVDYICLHWYDWGGWSSYKNPNADATKVFERFKSYLSDKYKTYKLPLWITEFNANKYRNYHVHKKFLELAIPYMESLNYVERYSYFQPFGGNGNFFEKNGDLTTIGKLYKNTESNPSIPGKVVYGAK